MITPTEDVVAASEDLLAALSHLSADSAGAEDAATTVRRMRGEGISYRDILGTRQSPLLELTKTRLDTLQATASRFRRATARALHTEGVPMEQIGVLLGVSRQRVSVLVQPRP